MKSMRRHHGRVQVLDADDGPKRGAGGRTVIGSFLLRGGKGQAGNAKTPSEEPYYVVIGTTIGSMEMIPDGLFELPCRICTTGEV